MSSPKKPPAKKKPATPKKVSALKRPDKSPKNQPTKKQLDFVNRFVALGNAAQAAREAGYSKRSDRAIASQLLSKPSLQEIIEQRRDEARRRAQIDTDEIIGSLAEIAGGSIGDVLESDGRFKFEMCRERGTDRLIKKMKITERLDMFGNTITTYELEMYDRLNALAQLRETFGMKQEPRANRFEEKRKQEIESSIQRIMESEQIDRVEAGQRLLASLNNSPDLAAMVSKYVN